MPITAGKIRSEEVPLHKKPPGSVQRRTDMPEPVRAEGFGMAGSPFDYEKQQKYPHPPAGKRELGSGIVSECTEEFYAGDEMHTLWIENIGGSMVVMVASDPVPVAKRLYGWRQEAGRMADSKLKQNILEWIERSFRMLDKLKAASVIADRDKRMYALHEWNANLQESIKDLFWAFSIAPYKLGMVAVYRGLHFTTDWEAKRGRRLEDETARTFEDVKIEGSYSSAVWELAGQKAGRRKAPYNKITKNDLEEALRVVEYILQQWKNTTDDNRAGSDSVRERRDRDTAIENNRRASGTAEVDRRTETDKLGKARADLAVKRQQLEDIKAGSRTGSEKVIEGEIEKIEETIRRCEHRIDRINKIPDTIDLLEQKKEHGKSVYTQIGFEYENQFKAAMALYVEGQSRFEGELADQNSDYRLVPFKEIPFISTTKQAKQAVLYALGKLAGDAVKNTEGVVGRVLIYIADRTALLEAGGIDVWQQLCDGKMRFTDYRMNENEITFSGSIPDNFLKSMVLVDAGKKGDDIKEVITENTQKVELEAARVALPYGGLKELPVNKPRV